MPRNTRKLHVRRLFGWAALALLMLVQAPALGLAFEITIDVSPNVLNLQSQGEVVTVHTDIAYGAVDVSSVFLNGVLIHSWKADDRGFFVAKFVMNEIKDLPLEVDAENTLTLIGQTKDGEAFSGLQQILVINKLPRSR